MVVWLRRRDRQTERERESERESEGGGGGRGRGICWSHRVLHPQLAYAWDVRERRRVRSATHRRRQCTCLHRRDGGHGAPVHPRRGSFCRARPRRHHGRSGSRRGSHSRQARLTRPRVRRSVTLGYSKRNSVPPRRPLRLAAQ